MRRKFAFLVLSVLLALSFAMPLQAYEPRVSEEVIVPGLWEDETSISFAPLIVSLLILLAILISNLYSLLKSTFMAALVSRCKKYFRL